MVVADMNDPIPFPKRVFRSAAEAAWFADARFDEVVKRRKQAAMRCDRNLMQVVIDIYRRDIIPYNSRFEWHLSYDLLNFGEWLRDPELIDQSIEVMKRLPPDTLVTREPVASARKSGAIGKALLARCEIMVSRPLLLEAVDCFAAALEHPNEHPAHDLCPFEVGLALSHLSLAEIDSDSERLEASILAFERADALQVYDELSLDMARQQYGAGRVQLLMARLHGNADKTDALQGIEEAIQTYRSWKPRYVVPPVWIERLEKLRSDLSEL
jgi:tetratricopeptide (TPR) repeat protein